MSVVDPRPRPHHDRTVVALTVVAVLLAVGGPTLAVRWEGVPPGGLVERVQLTDNARRVLAEVPGSYEDEGVVVVPAATDPYVAWAGSVSETRIVGGVVELGVRGITRYGTLPPVAAPDWLFDVGVVDAVVSDVGDLSFACVRNAEDDGCTGTLLARHVGQWFTYGGSLGAPGEASATLRLSGLSEDGFVDVFLGWLPPGADSVTAELTEGGRVPGRTGSVGVADGERLWWVVSADPVAGVSFLDEHGEPLDERNLGG